MHRRAFFSLAAKTLGLLVAPATPMTPIEVRYGGSSRPVKLFLCGDVMTGRGIDQVLAQPSDPVLHEPYVRDARRYVELAERISGALPRPVAPTYVWGDALDALDRAAPDLRIVNLETAVTRSDDPWPGKGIHYRMHPGNVPAITAAGIDCCVLANNHVLDWGHAGLAETLATLRGAGLATAGAGRDGGEAEAPAVLELGAGGRVLVFSVGSETSGIPAAWAAAGGRAGVSLLPDLSDSTADRLAGRVRAARGAGDLVVVSIHWGPNWGYEIPRDHRRFAHRLIAAGGADLIHGHSSHHPLAIEVLQDRPILYGCGDFLNDYEGIEGHERYRPDLALAYLASLEPSTGRLVRLELVPFQVRRFRLNQVSPADALWLRDTLDREGEQFGTRLELREDGALELRWESV